MAFIMIVGGGGSITKFFWMFITVLTLGVDGKLAVRDDATYHVASSAFFATGQSFGIPITGQMIIFMFRQPYTNVYR